ncbi:exopolyphosphatase/guanosine-5'-triphosphate,3'-diphosphate pyrophosphatase [Psychromicrobium silvestre]|uniref:Exopolyphosphatase/guanosine-5'-triphosphate, 3'-diphosphate pyrophosphatase n=1 Tax=Psychromicrobium silvestre TaxID=1645614 RepID=A0A7Y9S824_9MICC|nr:Ppx/GppA phosphatase family protein [Psychromicrobium silvestre]NYE95556.1 exopolyphosphatase/guanosine-5'-triphosphate,3'-diphosphate pyrophosphatase [Psychromicrobium silvestre]
MRLGVLDIGSNTVHLLLVDAHPGGQPVPFASHKRPLSLVQYLDQDGAITETGQHELVEFVQEAKVFAAQHSAEDLLAFCTSAIREASNGESVLERVRTETSIQLRELTGPEEAAMTFFAVRRWYGWGAGTVLDLDIGGGSFELAMGADELPSKAVSVPLGAGRLTRDWLPEDPPTAKSVKELRKYIRSTLKAPIKEFSQLGTPNLVVGTSKTFRSLARITGAAPSAMGPFARRELHAVDLGLWTQRLTAMSAADRLHLPGVSAARALQLLAGALVAEAALELFKVSTLQICPWALREGLILRRLDQLVFDGPLQPPRHVSARTVAEGS